MGYGKTYKTKWLEDLSGNQGTVNQVLISTSAGIAWATASTIIGGPYLPLSGGTMTGNTTHGDNVRSLYGASSDMQIYHDGSNSYVRDVGTGRLWIDSNGEGVSIISDGSGSTPMAHFYKDGAVELYHNNVRRFKTNDLGGVSTDHTSGSPGNSFFGGVSGASNGFQIANSSSNEITYTFQNGSNSQVLKILNNGNVGIGTTSPESKLHVAGGNVLISNGKYYTAESTTGQNYKLAGITTGNTVAIGAIDYTSAGTIFAGGDNVSITTGGVAGSSRLKILSNGNVGIGTTSPGYKLQVDGGNVAITGGSSSTLFLNENTNQLYGDENGVVILQANDNIRLRTNSSERLRINSSGNVGIGTTSPDSQLEVYYGPSGNTGSQIKLGSGDVGYETTITNYRRLTDSTFEIASYDDTILGYNRATSKTWLGIGSNVGIGTTSPLGRLQVNEYTVASQGNQNINGELSVFANNGDESLFLGIKNAAYPNRGWAFNPVISGVNSSLQIKEHGASGVRMTIQSGGNVGIGTTNIYQKLDVQGNVNVSGGDGSYLTFNNGDANIVINNNGTGRDLSFKTYNGTSTAEKMRIDKDGNVGIGTTSPAASALFEVASTTKGVLLPRMNTTQINAISSPAEGLTVYNTVLSTLCFFNGVSWQKVTSTAM